MATRIIPVVAFLLALVVASASANATVADEVSTAVHHMQQAKYYTFVTLINMVRDRLPSNATFLMPSDRKLSQLSVPENEVMDFLSGYSVPSPLSSVDLARLPSGTLLPTFKRGHAIVVSRRPREQDGASRLYLNDAQLVQADVCAAGASFRCHGIGGFLWNQTSADVAPAPANPGAAPPSPGAEPSPPGPAAAPGPSPAADAGYSGAVRMGGADAAAAVTSLLVIAFMRLFFPLIN